MRAFRFEFMIMIIIYMCMYESSASYSYYRCCAASVSPIIMRARIEKIFRIRGAFIKIRLLFVDGGTTRVAILAVEQG